MTYLLGLSLLILFLSPSVRTTDHSCCSLTVGAFQPDAAFYAAQHHGFFKDEGLENVCGVTVFTSDAGYADLESGTLDILNAAFDNVLYRAYFRDPPLRFSLAAGSDMGHGYVALARNDTLETLNKATYAADGAFTAFIIFAYEMARLSGVDLSTLRNVSGFSNAQRNALANGETVRNKTADWVFQSFLFGIREYYHDLWPELEEIGKLKDFVWPIQGSAYTVRPDAQDDPVMFDKLRRFFRALLRGYLWVVDPQNRPRVISILRDELEISTLVARRVYEVSIDAIREQTGLNPLLVLTRRGLRNNVILRFNQGLGPSVAEVDLEPGAGKFVDLRALDAAISDLGLGSAYDCYENELVGCFP